MTTFLPKLSAAVLFALLLSALPKVTAAQAPWEDPNLEAIILRQDSLFWITYNTCDLEANAAFLAEDLEFYHDKGGFNDSREEVVQALAQNICGEGKPRVRREAVPGTVQVYPVPGYGAIITGQHVFYQTPPGEAERRTGIATFTHVLAFRDGKWLMTRVLSYDHRSYPE
ncbi:MAG: nuclear transport factor 2 family protein [Lewinella sp.]|nr:nuclear transport factor 2 family protein [Lewinella sp.]